MFISKEEFIPPTIDEAIMIENWSDYRIYQKVNDNHYLVVIDRDTEYLCETFKKFEKASNFISGVLI